MFPFGDTCTDLTTFITPRGEWTAAATFAKFTGQTKRDWAALMPLILNQADKQLCWNVSNLLLAEVEALHQKWNENDATLKKNTKGFLFNFFPAPTDHIPDIYISFTNYSWPLQGLRFLKGRRDTELETIPNWINLQILLKKPWEGNAEEIFPLLLSCIIRLMKTRSLTVLATSCCVQQTCESRTYTFNQCPLVEKWVPRRERKKNPVLSLSEGNSNWSSARTKSSAVSFWTFLFLGPLLYWPISICAHCTSHASFDLQFFNCNCTNLRWVSDFRRDWFRNIVVWRISKFPHIQWDKQLISSFPLEQHSTPENIHRCYVLLLLPKRSYGEGHSGLCHEAW